MINNAFAQNQNDIQTILSPKTLSYRYISKDKIFSHVNNSLKDKCL